MYITIIIIYCSFCKSIRLPSGGIFCRPRGTQCGRMSTANGNSNVVAFPELCIDRNDVSSSWRNFSQDFVLAIELRELELDARYTNPRTKVVALLRAVGQEERDFLQSVGFDIRQGTYEEALDLLDDHYGRKENSFVKTQKICYGVKMLAKTNEIILLG